MSVLAKVLIDFQELERLRNLEKEYQKLTKKASLTGHGAVVTPSTGSETATWAEAAVAARTTALAAASVGGNVFGPGHTHKHIRAFPMGALGHRARALSLTHPRQWL